MRKKQKNGCGKAAGWEGVIPVRKKKPREPGPPLWAWYITWSLMVAAIVINLVVLIMRAMQ